jgi:DNA-3-methyladenine glycosylase II
VNGIACQQVSLNLGIILLNRLTSSYGLTIKSSEDNISYAFPRPEDLSKLSPGDFRKLGFSRQKGHSIIELAQSIMVNQVDIEQLEKLDNAEVLSRLCQLRGIGRWTADYILLRGLGRIDVFPADDAGARRGLQQWLNINQPLDYEETQNIIAKWKPYRGLIYFHLLLNRLEKECCLN